MQAPAKSRVQPSEQPNRRTPYAHRPNDLPPGVFRTSPLPAVNVASVAQRSPLRYPGGKTWLIPHIKEWLTHSTPKPRVLIEPFCGGGIVSLAAVMEQWADRCLMLEVDRDVAAFWHAALGHGHALADRVVRFELTRHAINELTSHTPKDVVEHGFRTLVLNRTRRGGCPSSWSGFHQGRRERKRPRLSLVSGDHRQTLACNHALQRTDRIPGGRRHDVP